jgi:hypothetical protein
MRFHVASCHWEVVPAIKLHKWRKHGHQHDQQEHDFWRIALHKPLPRRSWKKRRSRTLTDCGDYSIKVINCNNLSVFAQKLRLIRADANHRQTPDFKQFSSTYKIG